jgi:chitinase
VKTVVDELVRLNLPTVHMISIGGWDAPHPDTTNSPAKVYSAFKAWNAQINLTYGFEFMGVDWDLEGNDDPKSPYNEFTVACLDLVVAFSQLLKQDGYLCSLVPPESYFDPTTSLFDRSLLHAYPDGWQPSFTYHGHNAYAYLVAKSPSTFDIVSIQLYETYSHCDYNITVLKQSPSDYLIQWVPRALNFYVDFSSDPSVNLPSQNVTLSKTQLVIGVANAWAGGIKAILLMPNELSKAYTALLAQGMEFRGVVFWTIANEGDTPVNQTSPLYMSAGINSFLHTRE